MSKRWQTILPPFFQAKILCATSFVKTGKQEQLKVRRIRNAGKTEMTVQTSAHIYRSNAVMFAASIMNFLHFFADFFTFTVHCLLPSYNSVRLMGKFLSPNTFSNGFGFGGGI